jgi:lipopolysaccharide export system permease protein
MKIIDRYIMAVFARFFLMAGGLLVTLFVLILFFELIGDFVRYKAPLDLILRYFLFKAPEAVYYMTPMAVLAAATLTLSLMSKDREILALMSSGVSAGRIAAPILAFAAIISVLAFLDSEYVMPQAFKKSEDIHRRQVKKVQDVSFLRQNRVWIKTANEDMWNIGYLDAKNSLLYDVNLIRFAGDMGGFSQIISAAKVYRAPIAGWTFENGIERTFDKAGGITESAFQKRDYELGLEFAELKQAEKMPQEMNFSEITGYIKHIKTAGYNDIRYSVDRYVKLTFPLISLVMAFIAIPFGLGIGGRASGALPGITFTVIIGFVFWFSFSMAVSMGHSGKLPPLVAASGAHVLFLTAALYLMLSAPRSRG